MIIGNAERIIQWLFQQDKGKLYEIKEKKNKRSLSQNSYSWVLTGELADRLRLSKEEVHARLLKDYGQSQVISVIADADVAQYFEYYDEIGEGSIGGKKFKHYKVYKESHKMDSREMSIFIDGIVRECEQLGIPTLTDEEIARLRLI